MDFKIIESDQKFLLTVAKKSIFDKLNIPFTNSHTPSDRLNFNSGCFVSLHMNSNLRGCIGNFREDINIIDNIREMAGHAAFSDTRFHPLTSVESSNIMLEISVLSPMTPIKNTNEIIVNKHGIYIKHGIKSGVLLPQVATEHKWSRDEFLSNTCLKAGIPADSWKNGDIEIFKFEAIIFHE